MRRSAHCNRLPGYSRGFASQASVPAFIDSALTSPRADLPPGAARAQMAEDMRQAGQREGGISENDLKLLGWTPEQIIAHAAAANIRAQRMSGLTL